MSDEELLDKMKKYIGRKLDQGSDPNAMKAIISEYMHMKLTLEGSPKEFLSSNEDTRKTSEKMANGWKTPKQIQRAYGLADKTWAAWRKRCEASPCRDAIVRVSTRSTFIIEKRWQDFLRQCADEFAEKHLDPHLRDLKVLKEN